MLVGVTLVGACASIAGHDTETTVVAPFPLHGEAAAFNPSSSTILLIGGSSPSHTGGGATREWDQRWYRVADSAASPPVRSGTAMEYNRSDNSVLLYGGFSDDPARSSDRTLCDTWRFANHRWLRLSAGPCVSQRQASQSLVFSVLDKTVLLIEGPALAGDTVLRPLRLWKWLDNRWSLIDSAGPRRVGFSAVAYDDSRRVLVVPVLYGGPDAGVWEWNGVTWKHLITGGPSHRQTYALVYDARQCRVVLAGGQGGNRGPYLDDFWSWDGREWTEWPHGPTSPPGRGGGHFFFDGKRNRFLYFGGYDEHLLADWWIFSDGTWASARSAR